MKLIADSGSTKTDWLFTTESKRVHKIRTQGINPFYQNSAEITHILETELIPQLENQKPEQLFFYGAGCSFPEKQKVLSAAFENLWGKDVAVALHSDLVAAARALCGNKEGIACILGTGSNSCHWNGQEVVKNVPPLGYILGDEGSGAVLGKLLIADLLKNQLPEHLARAFYEKYDTCYEQLMAQVYKRPFPNRSLATYTYFLHETMEDEHILGILKRSFTAFAQRNLSQYPQQLPVHFLGSVAVAFQEVLKAVLSQEGYTVGLVLQSPIEALRRYHA